MWGSKQKRVIVYGKAQTLPATMPSPALPHRLSEGSLHLWPGRLRTPSPRWSLTSLQQRLMKDGGRLVKHARYYWLFLVDGQLNRKLFGEMLG